MLTSDWLGSSAELRELESGGGTLGSDACEETIRRVQGALLALGYELPTSGPDGTLNGDTAGAIVTFKAERKLQPADGTLDAQTLRRMDYELAYREGTVTASMLGDRLLLPREPVIVSLLERAGGPQRLQETILNTLQLGDTFCFRLSFTLSASAAQEFSELVAEPKIFSDYCAVNGPCTPLDFFDRSKSFKPYRDFLVRNNPGNSAAAFVIGNRTRPDILSHRPGAFEWYEIKPQSVDGIRDAVEKLVTLTTLYSAFGYPYVAGTRYVPTRHISLGSFVASGGEGIEVYLEVLRPTRGLIFWSLCFRGDYVRYFNRVRLIAGILAILAALAAEAGAVGAAAGAVARAASLVSTIAGLATSLGLAVEVLRPRVKSGP